MRRSLRMWSPRRRIHVRRRGRGLLLAAAVGIGLALLVIWLLDAALRPAVTTLATVQAQNKITGIVNDAVTATLADQGVAYADLVTVERDESGKVSLLAVDSVKLNTLRTQILQEVLEQVQGLDAQELGVPLGSLTGFSTASDWGTLLIPGGRAETSVTAQVCVAETLLVGEVPDTYLGLPATGS